MATSLSHSLSKQRADDHLRDIIRRKGVEYSKGRDSDNVGDLHRALDILSDQLYSKPTHFLLELIQNADDNTFDNDIPTLSFYLRDSLSAWEMRIACNEVGFEEKHVEALCSIGNSTKRASDRIKGYIGEKGIGFKSVFNVADVVHISSKAYSFRFDRRRTLGMLTPIIETFPTAHVIAGQIQGPKTQILLELNDESKFRSINNELENLEPQILIFLHKISKLVIHTPERHFQFEIRRAIKDQDLGEKESVTLTSTFLPNNRKTNQEYLIVRHNKTSLPDERRRANVKNTEIVLAFPVDYNMQPLLTRCQQTYAYLPLDDYGFKYLIQGDFLLVANRERLDSSEWNKSVLEGVYEAFLFKAVPRFNKFRSSSPLFEGLRYTWPLFLKDEGGIYDFWSGLKERIFTRLAEEDVLESRHNGQLSNPKSLLYIPLEFRLEGKPLIEDESSDLNHLSFRYDSGINNILPELKKMGVRVMKFSRFYEKLKDLIAEPGNSFLENQSGQWHSKVASLFCQYGKKTQVANIPIIPLRDGRWATPSQSHLFLERDNFDAVVPSGIEICLVVAEACQDANRKAFFRWCGIKKCDQAEVCQMIMECYTPFRARSLKDSVHDLIYLFQTPPHIYNKPIKQLKLVSDKTFSLDFMYGNRLYIEYPGKKSIISKYAGNLASNMTLLHPNYTKKVRKLDKESEFVDWVCSRLNVSTEPRLVDQQLLLTPEFKFLEANAAKDLLLLLRDHWDKYAPQLDYGPFDTSKLNIAISNMKVHCTDGILRCLNDTALPLGALKIAGPNLPFIDIPEPNDPGWLKFSAFGVLTDISAEIYLRQLKALAALPVNDETTILDVWAVYSGLESSIVEHSSMTQDEFKRYPLVFHPKLKRWVLLSDCVWGGPKLSSFYNLSSEYPKYKKLFQSHLSLGNVTRDHVIKELQLVTSSTSFARLEELLILLNKYLKLEAPKDCMSELKGKNIIPVTNSDGKLYRLNYDEDLWYFADRQSLWDSFSGKLPLISFDVQTVRTLSPLIKAMGLEEYLLSKADEPKLETVGDRIYNKKKTIELRKRTCFFLRLVIDETARTKDRLSACLKTLKVWGVPGIKLTHKVGDVRGTEDTGLVVFDDADDSKLEIYFQFNDSRKPQVEFQLSKEFIRYCGITDHSNEMLVTPILSYPLEDIESFVEEHRLDQSNDFIHSSADVPESVSEEDDEENASLYSSDDDDITPPRTSNSGAVILDQELSSEVSRPSSFLRDRIPALDQRISSIRIAAALPSMAPILFITQSKNRTNPMNSAPGKGSDAKDITLTLRAGNDSPSAGGRLEEAKQSTLFATEHGHQSSRDAFDFEAFRFTFSQEFEIETPSQSPRISSTQQSSVPSSFGHSLFGHNPSGHSPRISSTQQSPVPSSFGHSPFGHSPRISSTQQSPVPSSFGHNPFGHSPRISSTQQSPVPSSFGHNPFGHSPRISSTQQSSVPSSFGHSLFGHNPSGHNPRRPSTQNPSVPQFSQSPRTPKKKPDPEIRMQGIHLQHIGLLGEIFVNDWLSLHLENDWDATRHWTSRNRKYICAAHPFTGREKEYADFTYPDTNGKLTNLLITHGFIRNVETWLTNPPTYHLEVKSTPESCGEPFYMSNNQVKKAHQYSISWDTDRVPDNVYIVIRVLNLENEIKTGFTMYVDPWAMRMRKKLSFRAQVTHAVTVNV